MFTTFWRLRRFLVPNSFIEILTFINLNVLDSNYNCFYYEYYFLIDALSHEIFFFKSYSKLVNMNNLIQIHD